MADTSRLFSRPVQSRALRIVDPNSRAEEPVFRSSATEPVSHAGNLRDSHAEKQSLEAVHRQSFDVYARSFVPEALKIINKLPAPCRNTPATKQIDFAAYLRRFVGSDVFLPIPNRPDLNGWSIIPNNITITDYELYFRHHIQTEIESQQLENESYALYGHAVTVSLQNNGQATCAFGIPGLRENSPYIEEDDIIQLRQLYYDPMGRPFGMEEWLAPGNPYANGNVGFTAPGGQSRGEPAPGWTNVIYNARTSVVLRKEGQLVASVFGLPASSQHNSIKFNIRFPVPLERFLAMQQSLSIAQDSLAYINKHRFQNRAKDAKLSSLEFASESWLQAMLFPTEQNCEVQTNLNPGFFTRTFLDQEFNHEQKKATESICLQNYGVLPFLISGPPGTGKTKTLVEIALQLLKSVQKVSHILICAPSDPAADIILQRLGVYMKPNDLLRLNRPTRTFAEVPGAVLPFCYITQDKFDLPQFRQLMAYQIVVTTCRDASLLLHSRLTNSDLYTVEYSLRSVIHPHSPPVHEVELHWTALLIDESAQATEPEALVPLIVIAPPLESVKLAFTPLVVMAGDQHQLGPRTSSCSSPLKTSLFERLFSRPVYADHPLARGRNGVALPALKSQMLPIKRPAFTNLIRNYRSHPAILAIPSSLFYHDTLEPEATDVNRLEDWSEWQGRHWPVLFRNNTSEDDIEMDGGGWYNIVETSIACQYAASLVKSGLVGQKEVCIMSPFKAQVKLLRKTIREQYGSLWDVDIGPTEAFQGLERGVVILCTTRSKKRFVDSDKEVDWGIIGLANKMNVALTRAKFGLVVIGNMDILCADPNWKAFIDFCIRNGLVSGNKSAEYAAQIQNNDTFELTRLEKVLLTREVLLANYESTNEPRALRGPSQEDEMWIAGMQGTKDEDSTDEFDN